MTNFNEEMLNYGHQAFELLSNSPELDELIQHGNLSKKESNYAKDEIITGCAKFLQVKGINGEETFSEFQIKANKLVSSINKTREYMADIMNNSVYSDHIELLQDLSAELDDDNIESHILLKKLQKAGYKPHQAVDVLLEIFETQATSFLKKKLHYSHKTGMFGFLLFISHMNNVFKLLDIPLTQGHYYKGEKVSDFSGYVSPAMSALEKIMNVIDPSVTQSQLAEAIKYYNKIGGIEGVVENLEFS